MEKVPLVTEMRAKIGDLLQVSIGSARDDVFR
jgi:hypothetical protein